jgi:hypothetical protein
MAAGPTYEPIATQTLVSAVNQVTFSSIPSTYTDLILVQNGAFNPAGGDAFIRFNSDTGTNYSITWLTGSGTVASSGRETSQTRMVIDINAYPTTGISTRILQINNYANTTTYKTALSRATNGATGVDAIVGLWRSTAAINTIDLFAWTASFSFAGGTMFTLYGIKSA